jgi:hypothetical protein
MRKILLNIVLSSTLQLEQNEYARSYLLQHKNNTNKMKRDKIESRAFAGHQLKTLS